MSKKLLSMAWVVVCLTWFAPQRTMAVDYREAAVIVSNKTSKEIEFVVVHHKYSNNYKDSKGWLKIPAGQQSGSPMTARYHTGFGTLGVDWWLIIWKFTGDPNVYATTPANLRPLIDALEGAAMDHGPALANLATQAALTARKMPQAGVIAGPMVQDLVKPVSDMFLNAEATAGYKRHMLEAKDIHSNNHIEIRNGDVRFWSDSGVSTTGYSSITRVAEAQPIPIPTPPVPAPPVPAALPFVNQTVWIKNHHSKKPLTIKGGFWNGSEAFLDDPSADKIQQWIVRQNPDGTLSFIANGSTGMVLCSKNNSKYPQANQDPIVLHEDYGDRSQRWRVSKVAGYGNGELWVVTNAYSNKALCTKHYSQDPNSTQNGEAIIQYDYSGDATHHWILELAR